MTECELLHVPAATPAITTSYPKRHRVCCHIILQAQSKTLSSQHEQTEAQTLSTTDSYLTKKEAAISGGPLQSALCPPGYLRGTKGQIRP